MMCNSMIFIVRSSFSIISDVKEVTLFFFFGVICTHRFFF